MRPYQDQKKMVVDPFHSCWDCEAQSQLDDRPDGFPAYSIPNSRFGNCKNGAICPLDTNDFISTWCYHVSAKKTETSINGT